MQYELEAVIIGFRFIADFRHDKSDRSPTNEKNPAKIKQPPVFSIHILPNPEKKEMALN